MLNLLLETTENYTFLFLRLVAGIIIFPYGMQKLLGWFDDFGGGVGWGETLQNMKGKNIPVALGWLIIIAQSLGSIGLILGFAGRFCAIANLIIFLGALTVHARDGWTMNWLGKKKGEGIEYFVLLLSLLLVVVINGSGAFSIDLFLWQQISN